MNNIKINIEANSRPAVKAIDEVTEAVNKLHESLSKLKTDFGFSFFDASFKIEKDKIMEVIKNIDKRKQRMS